MADRDQRIHPVAHDPEAPPQTSTAPLVPRGSSKSDKGDPNAGQFYQVPLNRTIPVTHSKPPKKRSCCCRLLCWIVCLLLLQIIVVGIVGGILFLVFRPKLPKYTVDSLTITQFNLSDSSSLDATFDVDITARNPNKKIGIYYEGGSHISVWYPYMNTKLCEGSLPKFYQGHRNTTMLNLALTGQTPNATDLLTSLQQQRQETGSIPLNLRVNVPVRIKLGKLKLPKLKFRVRCRLVVDNISANNAISIQSSRCKFRFRL